YPALLADIRQIADRIAGAGSAHDVHLYLPRGAPRDRRPPAAPATRAAALDQLDLVLHLTFRPETPIAQAHVRAEEIERALRQRYPTLESVVIHTEPEGAER